jgi:uncharacterized protein (TIGR00730 family)
MTQRICVFCGSNPGTQAAYTTAAQQLGTALARLDLELVYGGGHVGLMGTVADAVLSAGGSVIGVMPEALVAKEIAHTGLTELIVTGSMHERKARMADLAHGFIALPGGFGTYDELCEIITWGQLGYHRKPIGLMNVAGFYDGLLAFFDQAVTAGFIKPQHRAMLIVSDNADSILDQFADYEPPYTAKWVDRDDL